MARMSRRAFRLSRSAATALAVSGGALLQGCASATPPGPRPVPAG
jgi:hypothetical protein